MKFDASSTSFATFGRPFPFEDPAYRMNSFRHVVGFHRNTSGRRVMEKANPESGRGAMRDMARMIFGFRGRRRVTAWPYQGVRSNHEAMPSCGGETECRRHYWRG